MKNHQTEQIYTVSVFCLYICLWSGGCYDKGNNLISGISAIAS